MLPEQTIPRHCRTPPQERATFRVKSRTSYFGKGDAFHLWKRNNINNKINNNNNNVRRSVLRNVSWFHYDLGALNGQCIKPHSCAHVQLDVTFDHRCTSFLNHRGNGCEGSMRLKDSIEHDVSKPASAPRRYEGSRVREKGATCADMGPGLISVHKSGARAWLPGLYLFGPNFPYSCAVQQHTLAGANPAASSSA